MIKSTTIDQASRKVNFPKLMTLKGAGVIFLVLSRNSNHETFSGTIVHGKYSSYGVGQFSPSWNIIKGFALVDYDGEVTLSNH